MPRLRLSLTIPGAVSLGAYEGGALAALIVAAKELGEDVLVIDSIATASAGSTTGLLAARALLEGVDPVALLTSAWEENAPPATTEPEAPHTDALAAVAATLFGPSRIRSGPLARRQKEPVWLSLALSPTGATRDQPDLTADTVMHAEWYIMTLTNTVSPHEYLAYADAAIAAGAQAVGSQADRHDQPGEERQCDSTAHLGLPEDGLFWYTDGGSVDNQPLNRAIDLADNVASDDERLYIAITPDPAFPTRARSDTSDGDALFPPTVRAGAPAVSCDHSPSIYAALEGLEEMGSRRAPIVTALADALEEVGRRQANIESAARRILAERAADHSDDYAALLETLLQPSGGPPARRQVPVEVVSPSIDPSVADPPSQQLVGAFFNHFGGHFDITLRHSDFCLGYRNMGYWLEHRLHSYLPYLDLSAALQMVERHYDEIGWNGGRHGNAQFSAPSFRTEAELGTLAFHTGHAVEHDLIFRET